MIIKSALQIITCLLSFSQNYIEIFFQNEKGYFISLLLNISVTSLGLKNLTFNNLYRHT